MECYLQYNFTSTILYLLYNTQIKKIVIFLELKMCCIHQHVWLSPIANLHLALWLSVHMVSSITWIPYFFQNFLRCYHISKKKKMHIVTFLMNYFYFLQNYYIKQISDMIKYLVFLFKWLICDLMLYVNFLSSWYLLSLLQICQLNFGIPCMYT